MDQILDFFHYAKHEENGILSRFKIFTKDSQKWCPFNHNKSDKTNLTCYKTHNLVIDLIDFLEGYRLLFSYLEVAPSQNELLSELINKIKIPECNPTKVAFSGNLKNMEWFIIDHKKKFFEISKKFTCLESERLWEAIRCFKIHAYFATIVLTVSAIEGRLHTILRNLDKSLYEKEIEKFSFGQILSLRDPNQYSEERYLLIKRKIKEMIPDKHIPLVRLLNCYRIFSAHPKFENINFNITNSILSLSFAFLLDEKVTIPKKICNKEGASPKY